MYICRMYRVFHQITKFLAMSGNDHGSSCFIFCVTTGDVVASQLRLRPPRPPRPPRPRLRFPQLLPVSDAATSRPR